MERSTEESVNIFFSGNWEKKARITLGLKPVFHKQINFDIVLFLNNTVR